MGKETIDLKDYDRLKSDDVSIFSTGLKNLRSYIKDVSSDKDFDDLTELELSLLRRKEPASKLNGMLLLNTVMRSSNFFPKEKAQKIVDLGCEYLRSNNEELNEIGAKIITMVGRRYSFRGEEDDPLVLKVNYENT